MADLAASVIVPVRNGGGDVPELVEALSRQTLPRERFEVILADDGSTDGALEGLEAGGGWLRVLAGPPRNSYVARNRGARAALGAVLAFCDVDCRPEPAWLEAGLAALADADLAAGCVRPLLPERPPVLMLLDADYSLDQEGAVRTGRGATANLFLRGELLERSGGFDEAFPSGGDWDFVGHCVLSGARLVYAPEAVVLHRARGGLVFFRKAWFRNRWAATRGAAAGRPPDLLAALVPGTYVVRFRQSLGRPLGLDSRRLAEHGFEPRPWQRVAAAALCYTILAACFWLAHAWGWAGGVRMRRAARARRSS